MTTKKIIRQEKLQQRRQIPQNQRSQMHSAIIENIKKLSVYNNATNIALYSAMPDEVDLQQLCNDAIKTKNIFLPIIKDKNLVFAEITANSILQPNKFGIIEPTNATICPLKNIELIILPIVAFDDFGNRIGMGGGYYDRTLQNSHTQCLIGVAYSCQHHNNIPFDPWDIPLSMIVTENGVRNLI